jgi:hypothetical protein
MNGRWDEEATDQCPAYLRTLYINILATVKYIEEELKHPKNKHALLVKGLVWLLYLIKKRFFMVHNTTRTTG